MSETEGSGDGSSVLAIAGVMRILRLLRLARLLRGFLVCHELRLLVTGMMLALPTVVWAGVLFAIVVYLGTMFSVILLGNMEELHQYFGTFGLALWSHFVIVTMETWPDVADAVLEVASPLWGVYFVVFICVSSMSLMNLVTGVIAEKLLTTREDPLPEVQIDELEAFRKEKSALKADLKELFQEEEICADLFCGLLDSPKLRVWLNKLQVSAELPSNELFSLITSNNEALTLDGVVDGILSLRGSSVRVQLVQLSGQDLRRYGREELGTLEELQHDVQQKTLEQLQCLQQSLAEELACISALVEHDATAEEGVPWVEWEADIKSLEDVATELESLRLAPLRFQLATPQKTKCPKVVTTFPWDGEIKVKSDLEYFVLHFDRCVRLQMEHSATLFGRGYSPSCVSFLVSALQTSCARALIKYAHFLASKAAGSCNSQTALCEDLKIDFCVEWPPPQPAVRLEDDRLLEISFSVAVELNASNERILLEAGPEEGGGEVVKAWHLLQASKRLFWQLEYGNLTHQEVKDNDDGTGTSMGDQVYCAYAKYGQEARGQPCNDHRSFEVDLCTEIGNCPDGQQLPCGMILNVVFPQGLAISEGVHSLQTTIVRYTRPCDPPQLLNSLRLSNDGRTLFFSWSLPALVADPMAAISLCRGDQPSAQCLLEGVPISDQRVIPCITGPDSCTEWSLDVTDAGKDACGQLSLRVEEGAVRAVRNEHITSHESLASVSHPIPCGSFDEPSRPKCLELNDPVVLEPGQSNLNFQVDLRGGHIDVVTADSRSSFLGGLRKGAKDTPCAIIPKVAMKFWNGAERVLYEYVRQGGQLYVTGGHHNREILRDVFGLDVQHGHSGNVQHLQKLDAKGNSERAASSECDELCKIFIPESKPLQIGMYSAEETFAEANSFSVVEVTVGTGLMEYFAFDWYENLQEDRRPWAMQLALLAECVRLGLAALGARVAPVQPEERLWEWYPFMLPPQGRDRWGRLRYGWWARHHAQSFLGASQSVGGPQASAAEAYRPAAKYTESAQTGSQEVVSGSSQPYRRPSKYAENAQSDGHFHFGPAGQQPAWQPGQVRISASTLGGFRCVESSIAPNWRSSRTRSGGQVSIAVACDAGERAANCDGLRDEMLQTLLTPDSDFYTSLADNGMKLDLSHFAPPHVIKVLSECPSLQRIEDAVLTMNAACGFRASHESKFKHVIQSRLGVEVLTEKLRKQVCHRPVCRGHVLRLHKLLAGCGEGSGHKSVIARIVTAVDTSIDSCLEVHSATQGDATHSEVASAGSAVGVWSSDMSEVNHVLVKGIDTGSQAEMRAVEDAKAYLQFKVCSAIIGRHGEHTRDIFDKTGAKIRVRVRTEQKIMRDQVGFPAQLRLCWQVSMYDGQNYHLASDGSLESEDDTALKAAEAPDSMPLTGHKVKGKASGKGIVFARQRRKGNPAPKMEGPIGTRRPDPPLQS
eukprot:g28460.t1